MTQKSKKYCQQESQFVNNLFRGIIIRTWAACQSATAPCWRRRANAETFLIMYISELRSAPLYFLVNFVDLHVNAGSGVKLVWGEFEYVV